MASLPPTFLTLPSELRNAIYFYVFTPQSHEARRPIKDEPDPLAIQLKLWTPSSRYESAPSSPNILRVLQTCKQLHREAALLAMTLTPFTLDGSDCQREKFTQRAACLPIAKVSAIRHVTLAAKISHLRALNETWDGLPFANPHLRLATLTIVPRRADCRNSAFAELADLHQSHTLAYIFAETFKALRRVQCVRVVNEGCFNELVWRLVYRSLVYQLWRWGGHACGLRFEWGVGEEEGFCVYFGEHSVVRGCEVGDEVQRLIGKGGVPVADAT